MNAAQIIDTALVHLDDAQLAAAVRAISDEELAALARKDDKLRRIALSSLLEQIYEAGKSSFRTAPRAAKAPVKAKRRAPRRPASNGTSSTEERRERLVELVEEAGDEGIAPGELASKLGVAAATIRVDLKRLTDRVRAEGTTNSRRVYASG